METMKEKIENLPSLKGEALQEIIKGMYEGKPLLGPNGLLTQIAKDLIQISLQGEMEAHLQEGSLEEGGNRRNGVSTKRMKTASGSFELEVPRDRNSTFEPQLVKKRQTILNEELDQKILALYGLGTSYSAISEHLKDIYGVEVSHATISTKVIYNIMGITASGHKEILESVQ